MENESFAAEIKDKLGKIGEQAKISFPRMLMYYADDRFLYRLSQSSFVKDFILKGGTLLRYYNSPRLSLDIDMPVTKKMNKSELENCIRDVLAVQVKPFDALVFHADKLSIELTMDHDSKTHGFRVKIPFALGSSAASLQLDVSD